MFQNYQKGVSLIISFFVMTIILAVVLGLSSVLVSQIKIIKNIGNFVIAFYSADSGVEKTLYFDRKEIPENGKRGLCNICNVCPDNDSNCKNCVVSGDDCSLDNCSSCLVSYNSSFDNKKYEVRVVVTPAAGDFSDFNIYSRGIYENALRAIDLKITKKQQFPNITNILVARVPIGGGNIRIDVSANIADVDGVDPDEVVFFVQNPDDQNVATVDLILSGGTSYAGSWTGSDQNYYIDLKACDILRNCITKNNI